MRKKLILKDQSHGTEDFSLIEFQIQKVLQWSYISNRTERYHGTPKQIFEKNV